MQIDPWILSFSALTVIATIWMGFWSAKKSRTASDFFVAGRSVSVGWNASAISGEYLSAASFMGVAGMVMSSGYDALWYPVCYACGYLFLLLFIAGPLRRFGAYTIPDFAEGRYDSPVFRKIAVVFVLFIGFFYTMPQMKGAGTTLAYIFPGLPYWAGVVLVGAVITLNVALGGMKGITLVQAFQYWAKMFAISVPIFVLMAVYGDYGKQLGVNWANPYESSSRHEYINTTNHFLGAGISLDGWSKRLVNEKLARLEKTPPNSPEQADLAFLNTPFQELSANDVKISARLVLDLLAKNDSRQHWVYLTGQSRFPEQFDFSADYARSNNSPIDWFRAGFEKAGFSFIESTNHLIVVPTPKYPKLKSLYDEIGLAGLRSHQAVRTPAGILGLIEFDARRQLRESLAGVSLSDRLRHHWLLMRGKVLGGSSVESAAAWAVWADEIFSRISAQSGDKLLVAYELLELENDDRNHGIWIQFPGKISTSAWQRAAENALITNGIVAADGALPVRTNLCVIVAGPNSTRFVLPEGKVELYARTGLLNQSDRNPLPEKAPADSTWLSPFGPLTTKAAKAAGITGEAAKPYSLLYTYSLIIALVCGTAGLPHILVRFYTNPDGVAAKRTTMWVMILIGIFYVFPPVFGVMGRNLLPELYAGVGAKGTDKVVLELPRILNSDSPTHPLTGSPGGDVSGSAGEPVSGKNRFPWGSILSGITCAGAFAAFMSTFSGLLVSMTGALAHDVYGRMLRPKSTPEQRMRMFRIGAVLLGTGAIIAGSFVEPLQINFMVGQAFAIAAASYFPLLFMSAWWRGMTMKGAAAGMLTGGCLALIGISLTSFSDLKWLPLDAFWAAHPLLRILCEQPAIWTVPLAITLMVVVSKLTRKDIPSDIRMKMLVLHAPEQLGLKQEYIQEHQHGH